MKVRSLSLLCALITVAVLLITGGCIPKVQYDKCVLQNETLTERLRTLMAEKDSRKIEAEKWGQEKLLHLNMLDANKQKIEGLLAILKEKNALIEKLAGQVGQVALPVELSNALSEWASQSGSDMITYDEKKGVVRFKSDLLFDSGKDTVKPKAKEQLIMLSTILNSDSLSNTPPPGILRIGICLSTVLSRWKRYSQALSKNHVWPSWEWANFDLSFPTNRAKETPKIAGLKSTSFPPAKSISSARSNRSANGTIPTTTIPDENQGI